MKSPVCRLVTSVALCLLAAAAADAQECGPNEQTQWWPRAYFTMSNAAISAGDRTAIELQLIAAEVLVRKTPYSTPRGFAVKPGFSYHPEGNRERLDTYALDILVYLRCSKYDEHGSDLSFTFNPMPQAWSEGDRPMHDERGDGLYLERPRTETLFGATATYGHFHEQNTEGLFVLFTTGGESPTLPVTREDYLRALIFTLEGKDQAKVKETLALMSKTPYERWIEEAPARKKRNEEMYALIAKVDPAQAAKSRAEMEKLELAETEKLKKGDAYDRAELATRTASVTAPGDELRAQIAAMTPQERASAAMTVGNMELVNAGTPNAMAVVRMNPAFYRARRSPFEPRALLVRMPNPHSETAAQHEQLYRQLDWAAVKRLVNP
jgi:hypothetical protein